MVYTTVCMQSINAVERALTLKKHFFHILATVDNIAQLLHYAKERKG